MVAPNIVNVGLIHGKTSGMAISDTKTPIITNPDSSANVLKVNSVIVANTWSGTVHVTVTMYDASEEVDWIVIKEAEIKVSESLIVIGTDSKIYLEEGDKLEAIADVANSSQAIVSYELISENT